MAETVGYLEEGQELNCRIVPKIVSLKDLKVMTEGDIPIAQFKSRRELDAKLRLVDDEGRKYMVSDRFWLSFSNMFSLSRSVFDYWTFDEVFSRVTDKRVNKVRLAFEQFGDGEGSIAGKILSCTSPLKPILTVDEVNELVSRYSGKSVRYSNGVVQATFDSPFPLTFDIQDSAFRTMFTMAMPVDGYGLPAAFLTLLRLVCTNGMVGLTKAFKTTFQLSGNDDGLMTVLDRAVQSFNNEEGYHAFKERLEVAAHSWASLHNYLTLHKALNAGATAEKWGLEKRTMILKGLDDVCHDPLRIYGINGVNELSSRTMRTLPIEATVYDLLNYATEVASHHFTKLTARNRIQAWVGDIITSEYDLEGTKTGTSDFADIFLDTRGAESPVTPSTNQ